MRIFKKYSWLLAFLIVFTLMMTTPAFSGETGKVQKTDVNQPSHYLVVTYFHTTFRCPTCHRIEELSSQAVKANFAYELKTGKVVWQVINVDEPENKHYNKDYQLYTKSLIISEVKDGKEVRWKNLEKIWTLVRNEAKFDEYVKTEIMEWLKG